MTTTKQGVRDLNAPAWRFFRFETSMGFICPEHLVETLIAELRQPTEHPEDPGCEGELVTDRAVVDAFIDMPGMVAIGRPAEKFELAGITLEMPCEDVLAFVDQLERTKIHHVRGRSFFIMVGMYGRCVVLTPRNRERLLGQMRERLPLATEKSRVFYATRRTPQQTLKDMNEQRGLPRDTPGAYQNDHRAIFRPPHGGEA